MGGKLSEPVQTAVPKVLLTIEEAAQAHGLSRTFVYELVMRNEIQSVKVGRKRGIPIVALQEFVVRQLALLERGCDYGAQASQQRGE